MSQNTSHAVMAQRHEAHDSLDFFPTPPWATRALIEKVLIGSGERKDTIAAQSAEDPACGQGHMARPLAEYFASAEAADCHDYGFGQVHDFLLPGPPRCRPDWIITNPPFRLAQEFAHRGLEIARRGICMLVRSVIMEGEDRYKNLFKPKRPSIFAPFVERVIMAKGRVMDPEKEYPHVDPKTGETVMKKPSTATAYCWIVWQREPVNLLDTVVRWIPPCRKSLERLGDYA